MIKTDFILAEHDDGSISVSYEDYEVEAFGGADYEASYSLDPVNAGKLRTFLKVTDTYSLKEAITDYFGIYLDQKSFAAECDENGIKYDLFTWIS